MKRPLWIAICLPLISCAASAQQPRTIVFYEDYLLARKISGETSVAPPKGLDYFGEIEVAVTIDIDGSVSKAGYSKDGFAELSKGAKPAVDAVKQWTFKPILYRGAPVVAQGVVSVTYRPKSVSTEPTEIDLRNFDYSKFKVSLQRTACYGSCPDYRVTILGTGQVEFEPDPRKFNDEAGLHRAFSPGNGILVPLHNTDTIDRTLIDRLIANIARTGFFNLKDRYEAAITDNPTYVVSVSMNGKTKAISDYVGERAGMPPTVTALEDLIDELAGTSRWIDGTEGFFGGLKNSGIDFQSKDAAMLAALVAGSENGSETDIIKMIEAGLPMESKLSADNKASSILLGSALLTASISSGKPKLAAYLIKRGWMQRTSKEMLNSSIAESGRQCNLSATELAIKAGLSPNARNEEGKTGLLQLIGSYASCSDDLDKFLETAEKWIALGADVNAADKEGNTAIFGLEKLDVLELLLAHGADPTYKDKEGRSAAFSSWQDAIVLRLLEAGADPEGKDSDGRTIMQLVKKRGDMPGTSAWLKGRKLN